MNIPLFTTFRCFLLHPRVVSCWIFPPGFFGFFSPWPGDPRVKVMVDKELPVYVMTLIAMSCAVAWQLCYPRKIHLTWKKPMAFSPFFIIVFFG